MKIKISADFLMLSVSKFCLYICLTTTEKPTGLKMTDVTFYT